MGLLKSRGVVEEDGGHSEYAGAEMLSALCSMLEMSLRESRKSNDFECIFPSI